jgi:hypothetical protein
MSVTTQKSTQATNHDAVPKVAANWYDIGGFLRFARVTSTQATANGDANSTMLLAYIPANALIVPYLGKLYTNALGTARTLDVGTAAIEDLLASAVDVSAETSFALDEAHAIGATATDLSNGILTTTETAIYAKCEGDTYDIGSKVNGFIAFLAE